MPKPEDRSSQAAQRLGRLRAAPHLADRARNLTLGRLARGGASVDAGCVELLPALLRRVLEDAGAMRRVVRQAVKGGLEPRDPRLAGPEHDLLRGLLAAAIGERVIAEAELEGLAANSAGHPAERRAAALLLRWLTTHPAAVSESPDAEPLLSGNVLAILEGRHRPDADWDGAFAADARITLVSDRPTPVRESRARHCVQFTPPAAFWYSAEGRLFHDRVERFASACAKVAVAADTRLQGHDFSVALHLVDSLAAQLWMAGRFGELARRGGYDHVVILCRTPRFAAAFSAEIIAGPGAKVRFTSRPRLRAAGVLPYWPTRAELHHAAAAEAAISNQVRRLRRDADDSSEQAALLLWSLKDPGFDLALERVLKEVLLRRPVLLVLRDATAAESAVWRRRLRRIGRALGRRAEVVRLPDIAGGHLRDLLCGQAISKALRGAGDGPIGLSAFDRHLAAQLVATSGGVMSAMSEIANVSDFIGSGLGGSRPRYCISTRGRSPAFSSIIEIMNRWGAPTVDAPLYLIGNSARQLHSGSRYLAVIDSQQAEFAAAHWGLPQDNVVAVGYLTAPVEPSVSPAAPAQAAGAARPYVLIATQPGDTAQHRGLLDVADGLAGRLGEGFDLVLKPHPRETGATLDGYDAFAAGRSNVSVAHGRGRNTDILKGAALVITRTSNIGIEASALGAPVLRCPYLEPGMDPSFNVQPYALNAASRNDAISQALRLLNEPAVIEDFRRGAAAYFARNPALLRNDGAGRLVSMIEARSSRSPDLDAPPDAAI